jgi:two-component system response regulator NreC
LYLISIFCYYFGFNKELKIKMIKIVLADDHHIVRKGLKALLSNETDLEVVGEAANGLEAVGLVERLSPDILVLDLMMPKINGLEVTGIVVKKCPATGIVILSMHNNEGYIFEAFRSGAKAYVLKDNTAEELITAIRQVKDGKCYLGPSLIYKPSEVYNQKLVSECPNPFEQLTQSEHNIMLLAVKGSSNADIAEKLGISHRTVETHCTNLMHKLGVSNRNQLIKLSVQHGII